MTPYNRNWWRTRWTEAAMRYDYYLYKGDKSQAMRYGRLANWIHQRIQNKYGVIR